MIILVSSGRTDRAEWQIVTPFFFMSCVTDWCDNIFCMFWRCCLLYDGVVKYFRFLIKGTVQGVGFRPYIYNACSKKALCGFVQNTGDGVVVEVSDRAEFEDILKRLPENARVDSYTVEEIETEHESFSIKKSEGKGYAETPPDFFLCEDCLRELNDPRDRRYQYFFITCTNCGPRFTTTLESPYDRDTTTMREFPMCEACREEYEDPKSRRYHAQTIACHDCGPTLRLLHEGVVMTEGTGLEVVKQAAELIAAGQVIAVKGVGGFHLTCNMQPETVAKLKHLTGRTDKPFALLARDMDMVKTVAFPNVKQTELLVSRERPIVLVPKKPSVSSAISELDTVGVMLPYTALHYLLFQYLGEPVVMTSSNRSGEPITTEAEEQWVPYVLDHSRKIARTVDDSVVKAIAGQTFYLRRSRGFVPMSIDVPVGGQNILALGAEMNNAFCVYKKEGKAILSQHMGNTANAASFEHFKDAVHEFLEFTKTTPELIVIDQHPTYNTSVFGEFLGESLQLPVERVQHHKAHAYGVALEHGLNDFVAIVADGTGYGEDGSVWGGEVFHNDERVGHLEQQIQVGGDSAGQYPAKMLFSILRNWMSVDEAAKYLRSTFEVPELAVMDKQRTDGFNSPLSSSCGRVFDAAAFLLNFCDERTYDGRPAMLLEANSFGSLPFAPVIENTVLMTTPLFQFLIENLDKDKKRLAATVQRYLAEGLFEIAKQHNKTVVFSGGCAYNSIMSGYLIEQGVKVPKQVPAGDGGISFGQIAYILKN